MKCTFPYKKCDNEAVEGFYVVIVMPNGETNSTTTVHAACVRHLRSFRHARRFVDTDLRNQFRRIGVELQIVDKVPQETRKA